MAEKSPDSTDRRTLADWLQLAQQYHEAGESRKAESLLRKLLQASPEHPHLLNLLGNLYVDRGQHDEAVELFRRASVSAGPQPALLANLGRALEARGDIDDALEAFQQAVELDPDNPGAHYHLGVTYQRYGRHELAAEAFARSLALDPDNPGAHNGRGAALQSLDELDEAAACFQRALALDPDHAEALNNLAVVHQERGNADRAIVLLQRAVALQPNSTETLNNLGRALLEEDRFDDAEAALNRALTLRPTFPDAHFALAQVFEKTGRLERAHTAYRDALAIEPDHLPCRLHLARLNHRLVPRWHFPMLNDLGRNEAYDTGIRRVITPGATVLDIGTGSGLLAMMAARAGAGHIYACETVAAIAQVAERIIADNGFGDRVTVLPKTSTDLVLGEDLPGRVDVIICEIFDAGLLSEGVVPVLKHARRELLRPGGTILPRAATVFAVLVESAELRAQDEVSEAAGFDVSEFNAFNETTYSQRNLETYAHRLLSRPLPVFAFDFTGAEIRDETRTLVVEPTESGRCDAVVFWFTLDLDGETLVSTGPEGGSKWHQAVQLVEPRPVEAAEKVTLTASHDGNLLYFELD